MELFTAKEYLKIDIANNFGLDKENWDVRLAWFDNNEPELEALGKLKHSKGGPENPAMFFAGVQAYRNMMTGKPIGYGISLDATASGMQLLAVLTNCRASASICNVVDVGKRMDGYTANYEEMMRRIKAEGGKAGLIQRKDTKRALNQ